jgi:hypothetical protein
MTHYGEDFTKVPADSPLRCQGKTRAGQCPNKRAENSEYCHVHGGHNGIKKQSKENLRNYNLAKFRLEVNQKADSQIVKSLREEIGILRLLLETYINKADSPHDLIMMSGPISDLVLKIEKLVSSCHRLESSLGHLLDKQAIVHFASIVINIISENIDDEDKMSRISDGILGHIDLIGNERQLVTTPGGNGSP